MYAPSRTSPRILPTQRSSMRTRETARLWTATQPKAYTDVAHTEIRSEINSQELRAAPVRDMSAWLDIAKEAPVSVQQRPMGPTLDVAHPLRRLNGKQRRAPPARSSRCNCA